MNEIIDFALSIQSESKSKVKQTYICCFLDQTKILLATSTWSQVGLQVTKEVSNKND